MQLLRNTMFLLALAVAGPALAEDGGPGRLSIELNAVDTLGESCRLTFLLNNGLAQAIDPLIAETVLISDQGQVVLLTLFDFGKLPAGRARVRQFQVPEVSCDRLGQVLVNGIDTCVIGGSETADCDARLDLSSRVRIGLEG